MSMSLLSIKNVSFKTSWDLLINLTYIYLSFLDLRTRAFDSEALKQKIMKKSHPLGLES